MNGNDDYVSNILKMLVIICYSYCYSIFVSKVIDRNLTFHKKLSYHQISHASKQGSEGEETLEATLPQCKFEIGNAKNRKICTHFREYFRLC